MQATDIEAIKFTIANTITALSLIGFNSGDFFFLSILFYFFCFRTFSPVPNAQRNAIAEIRKMTLLFKTIGFCTLFLLINNICMGKIESRLRVGKTINVFVRYGYLGISMKVISYNDTERWLFKEPTYNVFRVCLPINFKSYFCTLLFFSMREKFKFALVMKFFFLIIFVFLFFVYSSSSSL